jgi:CRP/FNR family cyclic AMP-dependent transcriptional regulator
MVADGGARPVAGRWSSGTVLHTLDPADRRALLGLGAAREFRPGETLITEGSRDLDTYVMLDGCCKVICNSVDGRAVLVSIRIGGDLVGELAALDEQPRSATVIALTPVATRVVTRPRFLRFLATHPRAAQTIHVAVARELRRATRYRVYVNGAPIAVRLAFVLDFLAETYGQAGPDGVRIDVPLSQPELASLIGASEPSLHRALSDLRTRNVIATRYRRVIVRDPAALRALAIAV